MGEGMNRSMALRWGKYEGMEGGMRWKYGAAGAGPFCHAAGLKQRQYKGPVKR